MTDTRQRSWLSRVFAHPFVLTAAGFLFTFIITTWVEDILAQRQSISDRLEAELAQIRAEAEAQKASVIAIDTAARARVVASDMLRSALRREAEEEIGPRKKDYDAIFVQWNAGLRANLIALRAVSDDTNEHAAAINNFVQRQFGYVDRCLTTLYDHAYKRGFDESKCDLKEEREQIRSASGADASQSDTTTTSQVDWAKMKLATTAVEDCMDTIRRSAIYDISLAEGIARAQARAQADESLQWMWRAWSTQEASESLTRDQATSVQLHKDIRKHCGGADDE